MADLDTIRNQSIPSQRPDSATPEPSPAAPARLAPARLAWILVAVLTGQFMAIVDSTIVNVATPTIRNDLHTTGAALQLIVAGYTIAYAVLLITGARLGGLFGYRRMFLSGLVVFTVASLACGLAPNETVLIAFRCIQGAGAAMMVPQVFSLIQRNFDGASRARALGLYAAVIALGAVVGQVLGGLLVTADILGTGWRPAFLVNVPVGIVLLIAAPRLIPADQPLRGRSLDVAGLVTLAAAVLLLVVPLVLGHEEGWPAWTLMSIILSVLALGAFTLIERAVGRRGGSPLISGRVLRAPGLLPAALALWFGMSAFSGFLFSFAQHLQSGLGETALQAGLTFAPASLGFAISSLNWRRLPIGWHRPMIPIGFAVAGVGYAMTALAIRDGGQGGLALPLTLLVTGLGMGFGFSPALAIALATVAPADAPDASGVLTTVIQLGQVTGVATFGSIFLTLAVRPDAVSMAGALTATLGLVAVVMVVCTLAALPLVRGRDAEPARKPASAAALAAE